MATIDTMHHLLRFFPPLAVLLSIMCYGAITYAASPLPVYSPEEDEKECLEKTGITEKDIPTSDHYYSCRASLARKRIIEPSGIVPVLSTEEKDFNKQMTEKAQEFEDRGKTIHQNAIEAYNKAFKSWDDTQTEKAQKLDKADHQQCIKLGFVPVSWGNPNTEKYYSCRARLITERAPPPPLMSKNDPIPTTRAAQFFNRKAEEAQYAFKVIDEQNHRDCTATGANPGELDDPKTKLYYECRAKLANDQMGPKIAGLFRQKAAQSADAIAQADFCIKHGIKKEDPTYQSCKEKVASYRHCLTQIDEKTTQKALENKEACQEETKLKLPDSMARGNEPAYTRRQLAKARSKMTELCIHEKKDLEEQYKYSLKAECSGLLEIAP